VATGQIMWSATRDGNGLYLAWPLHGVKIRLFFYKVGFFNGKILHLLLVITFSKKFHRTVLEYK
jgi:hypothetical protein